MLVSQMIKSLYGYGRVVPAGNQDENAGMRGRRRLLVKIVWMVCGCNKTQ
jgi:hypothetical protein